MKLLAEKEKLKSKKEVKLARIQVKSQGELVLSNPISDLNNSKWRLMLPRLEFWQFDDDLFPFWSQFEPMHKDITPEDKIPLFSSRHYF